MTTKQEALEAVQAELTQARQDLAVAAGKNENPRRRNELAQQIAALQAQEAALIPLVEQDAKAAVEWEAQEASPQARRELKQIDQDRAALNREAEQFFKDIGAAMARAGDMFQRVEKVNKLVRKHTRDKSKAIGIGQDDNLLAATYLLDGLRKIRLSLWARPDLQKYFPEG